MTQGIYISATAPGSGKSLISLGLANMLHRHAGRIGFFRPIAAGDDPELDPMVRLMRDTFGLPPERSRGGIGAREFRSLLAAGLRDEIDARCVQIYGEMSRHCDVIIVEGTDHSGHDAVVEFDVNTRLANNLGAGMLVVIGAHDLSVEETVNTVEVARKELLASNATLVSVMVNRAVPEHLAELAESVPRGAHGWPVYVIPEQNDVAQPTIAEVAQALNARQIAGSAQLDRDVSRAEVGAMTVGNFMGELVDGALVITPGDRADIMVASLASSFSRDHPVPSGMILTGDLVPPPDIMHMLAQAPFPIFNVPEDTYSAAHRVGQVRGEVSSGQPRKVAAALGAWARHVDEAELLARMAIPRPTRMTPLRFLHELIERARTQRKHIVLPEGLDVRILRAAEILRRRDVCDLTILGHEAQVRELAASEGINLQGLAIVDPASSPWRSEFAEEYARLRAHKGVDLDAAMEIMLEGAYFGTMMVQLGRVDGMVSGAAHTTANTIRPALEFVKTGEGVEIVSSVFLMLLQDRVLVYGDCAVNPDPTDRQLADIAIASAETAAQFGVEPRIAMLSYSTGTSGSGESVDKVRRATDLVRERRPDLQVEGPIQYDAAVNTSIAASKLPESSVAGQATVFIFPDLNTGNNTYKAVQQSSGAVAVGPVLQGLRKPVNDLSRGCTVEDIVNTVAITAVQAQTKETP